MHQGKLIIGVVALAAGLARADDVDFDGRTGHNKLPEKFEPPPRPPNDTSGNSNRSRKGASGEPQELKPSPPIVLPESAPLRRPEPQPTPKGVQPPDPLEGYKAVEHGVVGGATWSYSFGKPTRCDANCIRKIKVELRRQQRMSCSVKTGSDLARCLKLAPAIDPEAYAFALSLATTPNPVRDLASRVLLDEISDGEWSAEQRSAYASLKGRKFTQLDCHSNGAMICLAALRRHDVVAKEVRLFGPQITLEAAKRWAEIVRADDLRLTVYIISGDPVPAASFALPMLLNPVDAWPAFVLAARLLLVAWQDSLAISPNEERPLDDALRRSKVTVVRLSTEGCGEGRISTECHDFKRYAELAAPITQ